MSNPLALKNQLCFALYSANKSMNAMYRPLLDPFGLTYPQYLVFLVLWELQDDGRLPCKVTDIGNLLFLDTGTLTPLLKRMEVKGWLSRARLESDERVVGVALTADGMAMKMKMLDIPLKLMCAADIAQTQMQMIKGVIDELNCRLRSAVIARN